MAVEYFNSFGGFSAGIPPVPVVDANGNVITNVNTTGNVFANVVYATYYRYANGAPLSVAAGGSNTQLQFNNNGIFGGIPNVTWNGSTLTLGNASAVSISGGNNGYFLQTDGAGNLSWAVGGGGGGNGTPGGSTTQVQFNDAGAFGANAGFTFIKSSGNLAVPGTIISNGISATGEVSLGSVANLTILGGQNGYFLKTDGNGNLSWYAAGGNGGNGTPGGTNTAVQFNDDGVFGANAGFTFDKDTGILEAPIVNAVNSTVTNIINTATIKATTLANVTGNLRASGNVNFAGAANVNFGTVANVHITGGLNGYVLTTDGAGSLSWQVGGGGGGNGTPGGSNTQIQYNNNGDFGASAYLTFNDTTNTLQIGGNLIANTLQIGAGVYNYSTSEVYFATTASTAAAQVLFALPVSGISGAEFQIIATCSGTSSRQSTRMSCITYADTVQFNEYAGLQINGGVGDFQVDYNPGTIITPPSVELLVSPYSGTQTIYKMLITVFAS